MTSYRNSDQAPAIMRGSPPDLIPPRMDWDRPPWNRWAFHHIREILPTAEVWRGDASVQALSKSEQNLDVLEVAGVAGTPVTLSTLLDETYTDGFLVLKDGAIAYERYFNGMDARSLHLSQSVAKSFSGALAGILADKGLLDVSLPVTAYLPELQSTGWAGATVQQVLDMTTGVRFSEDYADPYSDIGQVDVASGWKPVPPGTDPAFKWPAHMWEAILRLRETTRPHGAQFEYRSIETDVLAFVLERASGRRLPQLLSEEIWQKMSAEESACYTVDAAGTALADGGLNACLRDYARFGQLVLDGGGGIIPEAWIAETRRANHAVFKAPYTVMLPEGGYHNQFWIEDAQSRSLMCRGVFGQLIYISWEYNMVVVKLSSWPDFINPKLFIATRKALHTIGRHLLRAT